MAKNMMEEIVKELFVSYCENRVIPTGDEINNNSEKIYLLTKKEHLTEKERIDLSNTFMDTSYLIEERGFCDGFAAGIKFIMQSIGHEMK
jgi:hypothetical protein